MKMTQRCAKDSRLFSADIAEWMARLKLLYEVPFPYLIPEAEMLPPESLRFFYLDDNWSEALIRGALSLGRVSVQDGRQDCAMQRQCMPAARQEMRQVRLRKMHDNHKDLQDQAKSEDLSGSSRCITGFIMRSILVRRMKGLEIIGKDGDKALSILRMESLSDDILIALFDGELTGLVISEPKTGLRFGSSDPGRIIRLRSAADDGSFGKTLDKTVDLKSFTEENGKVQVSKLAKQMGNLLGEEIGAAKLAYELIAVAHRAEFKKK